MNSMTGFGRGECTIEGRSVTVELRTVNNRYFDLSVKQPRLFGFAEDYERKVLFSRIARGHVDLFVSYENRSQDRLSLELDEGVAKEYLALAKQLEGLGVENDLTASRLLRMNDVVATTVTKEDEEHLKMMLGIALDGALDALAVMRAKEGEALARDLLNRLSTVANLTENIAEMAPQVVEDYKVKLTSMVKEALEGANYDEGRLITEICLFADKVNIDEELTRMRSHIEQMRTLFGQSKPVGRNADFLVQEMNREANTMGSKANNADMQQTVVAIKNELEKIREQIQNLE